MNKIDKAYMAGIVDGEGCISCYMSKRSRSERPGKPVHNVMYIRMEIPNTYKPLIDWLHKTTGTGWAGFKKYNSQPARYKPQWRWSCCYRQCYRICKELLPYLKIKKEAAQKVINHYDKK